MGSLEGKHLIVTGSAGFLASQFIPHLREQGATVHGLDIKEAPSTDITDENAVKDRVVEICTKNEIYGLVHAAALDAIPGNSINQFSPYESYSSELWERSLKINLTAAQFVTQAVAPFLMKQGFGSVVFIASDLALIAPNNSIYAPGSFKDIGYVTSKAGMLGLMRSWATYLGPYNVRVNALVPGGMFNKQDADFEKKVGKLNMLGRMARPGEYNVAVEFLLSEKNSFMTGSCLVVDGGRTAW